MNKMELINLIGMEDALLLTRALGGRRVWIGSSDARENFVLETVGSETYKILQEEFSGESIELPTLNSVRAVARGLLAEALLKKGLSIRQVAAETKLSRRGVGRIKQNMQRRE